MQGGRLDLVLSVEANPEANPEANREANPEANPDGIRAGMRMEQQHADQLKDGVEVVRLESFLSCDDPMSHSRPSDQLRKRIGGTGAAAT
jgi:hypothetical protein